MSHQSLISKEAEFPMIVELNFSKLLQSLADRVAEHDDILAGLAGQFLNDPKLEKLQTGLRSSEEVEEFKDEIEFLMETIFPYPLRNNEIKAATVPFANIVFYESPRLKRILEAAGPDFELTTRNMDKDNSYIFGCSLILMMHYKIRVDFKRPFYYDIPDANGIVKHYRVTYNGDFMDILPTERAKPITDEDVAELIDNFDNIDIWKEKFPPSSYIFSGFGIANVFDVTLDESLSNIKTNFINRTGHSFSNVQDSIRKLYGEQKLDLGITRYDHVSGRFADVPDPTVKSILLGDQLESSCTSTYCDYLTDEVLVNKKVVAISNVEEYGKQSNNSQLYLNLKKQGYNSYLCAPLNDGNTILGVLELASPINQFLNTINANKLDDVTPILAVVMRQAKEDHKNMLEVIIQEECTSIHPAVAWRFEEEAEKFYRSKLHNEDAAFEEIVFDDVYPLFGQCDIRGSSDARNLGIKKDLLTQLSAAEKVIRQAILTRDLPIYQELIYRLDQYKKHLAKGLGAGTDQQVLDFLKSDVYPVFEHLKNEDAELKENIANYMDMLDPQLKMVYHERKNYDDSVMQINRHLATYLDLRADEAQAMFPHFFERYKTDGVEYNMYIGQSLVKDRLFSEVYLNNLKLWQLKTMCELEQQFHEIKSSLKTPLEIASLILAYSTSLSIRFRMDEKHFDVDGAYNARYEIVKKRIDKAYIKGTSERLTQPGKLSIVYTQQNERIEYDKFAAYLKALGYIKDSVEYHVLEDLQGVTGLKAMRYTVNYKDVEKSVGPKASKKHVSA